MTHTLHVAGHADGFTIDGHDDECVIYKPCGECTDIPDENTTVRHDVTHHAIEGVWCVKTNECGATATSDGLSDLQKIINRRGPGDWPVNVTYLDNGAWAVDDVTANTALDILEDAIRAAGQGDNTATLTREQLMTVHRELLRYTV